jgi:hypothetical protein
MRPEMSGCSAYPVEHARPRRILPRHVEHQGGENQRVGCGMVENNLVQERRAAEKVVLDLALPVRIGFVTKNRREGQILSFAGKTRCSVELASG